MKVGLMVHIHLKYLKVDFYGRLRCVKTGKFKF